MSASRGTNASQRDDLYSSNMELSQTASENGSSPDREVESPVLATPIMPWQTPWGSNNTQEQVQDQQQYQATTPRNTGHRRALSSSSALSRPASFHHDGRSASFLVRERDRERVQRRVRQQHCHRQNSLNLLEARSINRTLDQQQQEARGEIAELRREQARLLDANHALRAHLQQERAALEHTREEEAARLGELSEQVMKLSEALTQQASLLVHEKKNRHRVEKELERCQAALEEARCAVGVGNIDIDIQTNNNPRAAMDSTTSRGDGDGDGGSTDGSLSSSSANSIPPPSASPSPAGLNDGCGRLPLVPEVLEEGKLYLTGTMSRWLKGMHSACSPQVRRALVLPWLLHKLFYLSTELIGARREELRDFFVGRVLDGMLYDEPAFLDHLRSNYLTLFPLSGDSQKAAIHDVMMGLACSMVESEGWNQSVKDPIAVEATLAASGLEKIVEKYLNMAVLCCLEQPMVTFTDDLGDVEKYSPERHSEPLDGEPAGDWVMIVFPAFVVAGGGGVGEEGGEEHIVGKRLVLNDLE